MQLKKYFIAMASLRSGENERNHLTPREYQVAELIAWGASKKEVPSLLQKIYGGGKEISVHTVENTLRNIFLKLGLSKSTELGAWWFCHRYSIDETSESPLVRLRRSIAAIAFLVIMLPQIINTDYSAVRPQRARSTRIERVQRRKE